MGRAATCSATTPIPSRLVPEFTSEVIQIDDDAVWEAKTWPRTPEIANTWGTGGPSYKSDRADVRPHLTVSCRSAFASSQRRYEETTMMHFVRFASRPFRAGTAIVLARALALAAVLSVDPFANLAGAQEAWPQRTVKFILPFGAGGAIDVAARAMGEKLRGALGQAAGDREPARRRRPAGDRRLRVSQRRPCAVVRFERLFQRASLHAREAAL